ncbi:MAG: Co2+/Mg2+ efflux protein ApaG, partial [Oricola sp.]|nr:Co2+/Mg2+ efflux protein ApaG [Oricola sp.]
MARGDRNSVTYERVTRGIRVSVSPTFLEDQSDPEEPRYVWAYTVRINNESDTPVQLRTRYWRITDSRGQTDIVAGDGVVGEQPLIRPGEGFEYTSGAPLATPSGLMVGAYGM